MPRRRQGRAMKNSAIENSGARPQRRSGTGCSRVGRRRRRDHGEAHRLVAVKNCQHLGVAIGEPAQQLVGLAMPDLAQRREYAGCRGGQIVQVVAIDPLDPAAIVACAAAVPEADLMHGEDWRNRKARQTGMSPACTGFPTSWSLVGLDRAPTGFSCRRARGRSGHGAATAAAVSGSCRRGVLLSAGGVAIGAAGAAAERRSRGILAAAAGGEHERRCNSAKNKLCIHR